MLKGDNKNDIRHVNDQVLAEWNFESAHKNILNVLEE